MLRNRWPEWSGMSGRNAPEWVAEIKRNIHLIDDKDARTIAQLNNLPVTGTLGILLKAKKNGLITSVKKLIDRLRAEHHFWIKEDMYQKVLHIANEKA
jgi:predicted nucleic acid-binding protein